MRRSIVSLLLMALATASVMAFMMNAATAETLTYQAQLLGANEPLGVTPAEANGFGGVTITLAVTRDGSNNITAATSTFVWTASGLPNGDELILSHIHEGAAGVSGPVRVDSLLTPNTAIVVNAGGAAFSRSGLTTPPDVATRLIANPSGFYFNIHSLPSPNGVMRGQLVLQQQAVATGAAPTLSQWGAILMALLMVAVSVFFLAGRKASIALASAAAPTVLAGPAPALNWRLLAKVTLYVEVIIGLALGALSASAVDVAGALASGLVVSFIIYLFIGAARRR